MFTSRLLGGRQPCKQFIRNFNFFRSKKDGSVEPIITEQVSLEEKPDEPKSIIIPKRELAFMNEHMTPRQAWVENFDTIEKNILGLIDLHPKIFGTEPRIDVIHENIVWQKKFRYINWAKAPVQIEVNKSTRKPWPQKGTGRARAGTRRSHIFQGGAVCHGPRGPKTHFYMLSVQKRCLGLTATLSIKLAQDDIHFIDRLEIPTDDPNYLLDLAEQRKWGASVLFVDVPDILTRNMALALDKIPQFMAMPVYGLNCYSMLKFETLVLTLDAVNRIEEKLLLTFHNPLLRPEPFDRKHLFD